MLSMKKKIIFAFFVLASTSSLSETLTLQEFLQKSVSSNLDLQISNSKLEAFRAQDTGINLPPPMLGIIQSEESPGNKTNGFQVTQVIPFPTKLKADSSVREWTAKAQEKNSAATLVETLHQGRQLYFDLWAGQEKLVFLIEKKNLLKEHIQLSRSVARSDNFAAIHILKIESELDLLENDIELTQQFVAEKNFEASLFLNEPSENFKLTATLPAPLSAFDVNNFSNSKIPQLEATELTLNAFKTRENDARSSWFPEFSISYREMGASAMTNKNSELMIGFTLPFLYFWEPQGLHGQALQETRMAELELEKQKRSLQSEKLTLIHRVESLKKQFITIQEKLIPRAEKRVRLVRNVVPRDSEAIQDHKETMTALPELKIQALEIRKMYESTLSALQKFSSSKNEFNRSEYLHEKL